MVSAERIEIVGSRSVLHGADGQVQHPEIGRVPGELPGDDVGGRSGEGVFHRETVDEVPVVQVAFVHTPHVGYHQDAQAEYGDVPADFFLIGQPKQYCGSADEDGRTHRIRCEQVVAVGLQSRGNVLGNGLEQARVVHAGEREYDIGQQDEEHAQAAREGQ